MLQVFLLLQPHLLLLLLYNLVLLFQEAYLRLHLYFLEKDLLMEYFLKLLLLL
jgi:hypothetical protein